MTQDEGRRDRNQHSRLWRRGPIVVGGEVASQVTGLGPAGLQEIGWVAGIPIGLLVLVAAPLTTIWLLVRKSLAK